MSLTKLPSLFFLPIYSTLRKLVVAESRAVSRHNHVVSYHTEYTYTLWELRPSLGCWGGSCRNFYALCHGLYAVHPSLNLYMLQCSFHEFRSSAALNGFLLTASQVSCEQDRGHSFLLVCQCISIWHFSPSRRTQFTFTERLIRIY